MPENKENISNPPVGGHISRAGESPSFESRSEFKGTLVDIFNHFIQCEKSVNAYTKNNAELLGRLSSFYAFCSWAISYYDFMSKEERQQLVEIRIWAKNWIDKLTTRYFDDDKIAMDMMSYIDKCTSFAGFC